MTKGDQTHQAIDVVVVGGGMVGLTLGIALAGAGIETAVIDRDDPAGMREAAFDGRVSAIAFGSMRVLDGIGVWSAMAKSAQPILEIRVVESDSPLFLHYDHREVGDQPMGWIVENRVIRNALLDAAKTCPHLQQFAPATVEAIERSRDGAMVRLADGRTLAARLVGGADGRRSRVREDAGIGTIDWSYPQTGIVCTVAHERPHRGVAVERFLPAGPFAILPMVGDRSSLVWTERADLAPTILALDEAGFRSEMATRFGDYLGELKVVGPRWSYPLALCHAESYVAERLALVGDAAHAIHPIAGQGLNLGIRDVAVLAELVVDRFRLGLDIGSSDVLSHYQRWRRFDSTMLIAVTDGLNRLFSNDIAPLRLIRDVGLAAVNQVPPLKRLFMHHAMGVVGDLPRLVRGEPL